MEATSRQTTLQKVRLVISNEKGLHARAAALLARAATEFKAHMTLECGGNRADAKSILGLMSLGALKGSEVMAVAGGPDAGEMIQTVHRLFACGFGENGPASCLLFKSQLLLPHPRRRT